MNRKEFTGKFSGLALQVANGTRVFPQTVLSVGAVESNNGNSLLASKYNNYFGIKDSAGWKGRVVNMRTGEYYNGKYGVITDGFRVYPSPAASFADFVKFLYTYNRYKPMLQANTWQDQVVKLGTSGYATAPNYSQVLLQVGKDLIIRTLASPTSQNLMQMGLLISFFIQQQTRQTDGPTT